MAGHQCFGALLPVAIAVFSHQLVKEGSCRVHLFA